MRLARRKPLGLAAAGMVLPLPALAHGFGSLYSLPVPLWLYAWGASAALVLSFVLSGLFMTSPPAGTAPAARDLSQSALARVLRRALPYLRAVSLFTLLLCMASGFFGSREPVRNFSMVFFWIVFVLAFTYLTALLGNFYAALNPWQVLCECLGRLRAGFLQGRWRYPQALGDWPALALFMAFIWFELFGTGRPASLASVLAGYTLLNLVGVGAIGAKDWFRYCEFFGVFLRLVGRLAPLDLSDGRLRRREFLGGIVHAQPQHLSTVVFVLAMLSTTAFDGLKATQWWVQLFWADPTGLVTQLAGRAPIHAIAIVRPWYIAWETLWLLASPFLYLACYLATMALTRAITRSTLSVRELALAFGYTLLPIALVYNLTHYATLLLSDGLKIISLLSDPFGWGWNLFGTAFKLRAPILPDMGFIWHAQVGLILFGHVASVYAAHRVALRIFPTRGQAWLSQLPMLVLMVGFTIAGLWILAEPLTAVLMR